MSAVVTAIGLLVRPLIITISDPCLSRSIIDRSRSCRGFNVSSFLLLCLIVIVGVIEDDYLAVTRRPEDVAVEIAKKLSGVFLIVRSIKNE
jgi:UDP-N-acetylmuramyl pentapeptide phosphotransferase/UDP-N-acetylglucosamine-1-phosphate transferase